MIQTKSFPVSEMHRRSSGLKHPNVTIRERALSRSSLAAPVAAFAATALILSIARWKAPFPILLADRFLSGTGWVEILALALYAAFLVGRLSRSNDTGRIRMGIWIAFSIVFFAQFIIGVAGVEKLLMTGSLHIPVPAVVIAGPIYRGARFFMPILFLSTVILAGPAWCSYLCYIGSWDGLAASAHSRAGTLSLGWTWLRISLLVATPAVALLLRVFGAGNLSAGLVAVAFGVLGAAAMAVLSTRRGVMVHCTSICPLGILGNILGKISPFRLRIGEACNECGRCTSSCRYNALDRKNIKLRRPAYTCTLCGDCIGACREAALSYSFPGLTPVKARLAFLTVVTSLHAVFMGVARI
jgi:polyferredoxin